jgi:hypothetical protein
MNLKKCLVMLLSLVFTLTAASAQPSSPAETSNAALRYWIAFADLHDSSIDKPTQDLLEKTASGEAAWDEAKLGPIVAVNEMAIQEMQRATKIQDCDWGLEFSQGPNASIAPVIRSRVMARLNTLYGMRLAAKGDTQKAVDTWLAGIRFSQHMAKGGSLIFSLLATTALLSNLNALNHVAQSGLLNDMQRTQVSAAVRALPETGFDWGTALSYEGVSLDVAVREMAASPRQYYQEIMGKPAPDGFTAPNGAETADFHKLMAAAETALRLPPDQAQGKLETLQDSVSTLHPFFVNTIPSFSNINGARMKVQTARNDLLRSLSAK